MVGEVVAGRYELEELVGAGGMSSVYRAHDRLLDRRVALKILHAHFADDDEYVERFRREARAVAQLSHPNIVTVIDRGEDGGRQFIVFEYVDGVNLKELVERDGPLRVPDALRVALGVARALAFAHEHGLVHRDVKPQNVLMNGDGRPKVTDFGIARSLGMERGVTQTGTVLGTSNYIAPEQASGERVDAQSDVYSLGVVVFELLTGELPFAGDNFVAVAMQHINESPPDVLDIRGDVPPRVAAAVDRALAKNPRDRFPTMDAFAAELEACLAQIAAGAREGAGADGDATVVVPPLRADGAAAESTRAGLGRPRRSPWPLLVALGGLLALGVIAVAAFALRPGDDQSPTTSSESSAPPAGTHPVRLVPERAYDPEGGDDEHSEDVQYAVDGNPSTFWTTQIYRAFQKSGVGFVVRADGGGLKSITLATDTPGFRANIQAGSSPTGGFTPVSGTKAVNGHATFALHESDGPYYLVWITGLPPGGDRAHVNELTARR